MNKNRKIGGPARFLSLGGDPLLDFCNTYVGHAEHVEDRLQNIQALKGFWAEKFHVHQAEIKPSHVDKILRIRSILREVLMKWVDGGAENNDLNALNQELAAVPIVLSIVLENQCQTHVQHSASQANIVMAPLINAIEGLFSRLKIERLKKCANPNCTHLFYDSSKSNTRSWCSMKSCGNIMKARAYYKRHKTN